MQDFRRLQVWQKAHAFVLAVYAASTTFPRDEQFGLTSQLRRAVVSILSNIAEGCGRETSSELRRFLYIAMGSASEAEYQLLLAHDLHFIDDSDYRPLQRDLSEIKRMLAGLIQRLAA